MEVGKLDGDQGAWISRRNDDYSIRAFAESLFVSHSVKLDSCRSLAAKARLSSDGKLNALVFRSGFCGFYQFRKASTLKKIWITGLSAIFQPNKRP